MFAVRNGQGMSAPTLTNEKKAEATNCAKKLRIIAEFISTCHYSTNFANSASRCAIPLHSISRCRLCRAAPKSLHAAFNANSKLARFLSRSLGGGAGFCRSARSACCDSTSLLSHPLDIVIVEPSRPEIQSPAVSPPVHRQIATPPKCSSPAYHSFHRAPFASSPS